MRQTTKISIIMTSYNHAEFLREAIDSVLNQTFSEFELIIWDDASTDDSWFIINSYQDPRIRAFRNNTNQHWLTIINKAISEVSTGEYIAIHHSDDIWEPEKLQRQLDFLDAHPQFGAVFTNAQIIDENGKRFKDKSHFYYRIFDQPNRSRYEWLNFFFYDGNALCHPSVLIRRKCHDECGLYRNGFNQIDDFDMWVRLCLKYEIHVIPEKLVRFRVQSNETNASGNRPDTRIRWQFEMLQVLDHYLKIPTYQELVRIFPAAQKYYRREGFDIGYVLGMVTLETRGDNPIFSLFGINLLFDAINNQERARKIDEIYGFSSKDFAALTSKYDVFSIELKPFLYSQLAENEQAIQSLSTRSVEKDQVVQSLSAQVAEKEQAFQSLTSQVVEKEQLAASLQEQLEESKNKAVELQNQLVKREHSAKSLQTRLTKQEQGFHAIQAKAIEYEQQVKRITDQIDEQKQKVSILNKHNTNLQQELIGLKDHLNQRENILQDLNSKLLEIYSSTAWKVILAMWKVRLWLAPKGSQRERIIYGFLGLFKKKPPIPNPSNSQVMNSSDPSIGEQKVLNQIANIPPILIQNQATVPSQIIESEEYKKIYDQLVTVAKSEKGLEYVDLSEVDLSKEEMPVKLIAFYLPQYHPIPENDANWGKGFTEWTNVTKAVPQFLGHYQPHLPGELGFYDLRVPDVQRRQVELAAKYGIYGFCFYYYWFNGRHLLDHPLNQFVNNENITFPFCICWANENWTRRWDGKADEILINQDHSFDSDKNIIHDLIKYFAQPQYIRINGRPLLIIYRSDILRDTKAILDYWRRYSVENGTGVPYIIVAETFNYSDPRADGFDAAIDFPPHEGTAIPEITQDLILLNNNYGGRIYRYSDFMNLYINRIKNKPYRRFNTISPGWDNEPRRSGKGTTFYGSSPELYAIWLEAASNFVLMNYPQEERLVFINAWNEWGEGAYLEPDTRFGYAYLQSTSDILKKIYNEVSSLDLSRQRSSQLNKSRTKLTIQYNNVIQSSPWFPIVANPKQTQDEITELDQLSIAIDNMLSNKVVDDLTIPLVSVIIPVFNHFENTLNCLKSFRDTNEKCTYEIIVVDDASTDATSKVLSKCKRIRYFKNKKNFGYLQSCNGAVQHARGKYILLLNNDTIVLNGWLDSLIDTFTENADAGLVGSKLLYPNGNLQEAGGLIWKDASGINYGRDDDPDKPQYNFLREADYCSGACLCIPKALWDELKGFDELFLPAYYEDTDLAFRVRKKGYKVLYQPFSQIIHMEGITSGTDIAQGIKQYQKINQQKFSARWNDVLLSHGDPTLPDMVYRNRTRKIHALVIDVCTPKPDQDSGSIDTYYYLLTLRKIGFEVTFISVVDSDIVDNYVTDLQSKGIECIYKPYTSSIDEYLQQSGKHFDIVFLFRASSGGKYINIVQKYAPQAKIIFNTVDLHFLREKREREITSDAWGGTIQQEGVTESSEILIMKKADQTIVVSDYEQKLLNTLNENIKVRVIPLPREIPGCNKKFEDRNNILFIGGFLHKPNVDAVFYFVKDIWPLINEELPECEFWIVGSNIPEEIKELSSRNIKIIGYVPDLSQVFSECKMSVAPLRYGAGIKGKILTSLSYGVPCVASPIAVEGMGLTHGLDVMIGSTPQEFSRSTVDLYNNYDIWEKLSSNGLTFVKEKYSLDNFKDRLIRLVDDLGIKPY